MAKDKNKKQKDLTFYVCEAQVDSNAQAYIKPCKKWKSKNSCPEGEWITWSATSVGGQMMYDTALMAIATGKPLRSRFDRRSCNLYDEIPMLRIVQDERN